ncbi:MAG: 3-phosphoserine/phosphohydroxythreonine transaminase [Bacteroidetes bacterium]|nr:3-phosphoserine/phosphohydroxythreonine transaminase [Bacteroidota bacterium]
MSKHIHNFSAGPCILPKEVMQKAAESVVEYNNSGLSIIEMSHRSKDFEAIMDRSHAIVRELMNVPENYDISFLQGGASLQFMMVPQNLFPIGGKVGYVNTGVWGTKALKEAQLFGETIEVASSKDKNFSYIPKGYNIPKDLAYLHITSNNTIYGTQFKSFPETAVPLVCDMSSDIMSKPVDVSKFDLIYGGAQKNIGPAGVVVVISKKGIFGKTGRTIPTMLDYRTHIDNGSMFNTPPCFSIYTSLLTMEWIKNLGGLTEMEKINEAKAKILYDEIDANPLFVGASAKEDRSLMNVTFVMKDPALEPEFAKLAKERNLSGIGGHRSVGGFRASIYNAMPIESVQALVDAMRDFSKTHA